MHRAAILIDIITAVTVAIALKLPFLPPPLNLFSFIKFRYFKKNTLLMASLKDDAEPLVSSSVTVALSAANVQPATEFHQARPNESERTPQRWLFRFFIACFCRHPTSTSNDMKQGFTKADLCSFPQ